MNCPDRWRTGSVLSVRDFVEDVMTKPVHIMFACLLSVLVACSTDSAQDHHPSFQSLGEVSETSWKDLSSKRIFFGHSSVGRNIIQGVNDLMKENPNIRLNVVETTDLTTSKSGLFAHAKIGENAHPRTKLNAFSAVVNENSRDLPDVSFFKFCWADFNPRTDVNKLFDEYREQFTTLEKQHPDTKFMHVTVPLVKNRANWKTWIKIMLGKDEIWELDRNIRVNEFNDLVMQEYSGKVPVFDLASIQSTYPDGTRETFERKKKAYYCMVPEYTHDGGHLNEMGRKLVADQLLLFLINNG